MQLGEFETNNIYNVDCYEAIKKLPDKSVDCIYTDVPYLIARGGCSDNDFSRRMKRLRDVDLGEIRDGIDYSILAEFVRVMKKSQYLYLVQQKPNLRHYEIFPYAAI